MTTAKLSRPARTQKLLYWIATIWLSFGMLFSGIMQFFHMQAQVDFITNLGYPDYFLSILGGWKILGVFALLIPGRPLLKEWAYAGFFFAMSGAVFSHIGHRDPLVEFVGPVLSILLIIASWYFRPQSRKLQIKKDL